jgi:hypothetical protein
MLGLSPSIHHFSSRLGRESKPSLRKLFATSIGMSSSSDISEVVEEDVQLLLTAIESEFKVVSASLDSAIKGLKALGKRVKKEGREDVLVTKGPNRGKRLADVLDLATGIAKEKGVSYGSVVLKELE